MHINDHYFMNFQSENNAILIQKKQLKKNKNTNDTKKRKKNLKI